MQFGLLLELHLVNGLRMRLGLKKQNCKGGKQSSNCGHKANYMVRQACGISHQDGQPHLIDFRIRILPFLRQDYQHFSLADITQCCRPFGRKARVLF